MFRHHIGDLEDSVQLESVGRSFVPRFPAAAGVSEVSSPTVVGFKGELPEYRPANIACPMHGASKLRYAVSSAHCSGFQMPRVCGDVSEKQKKFWLVRVICPAFAGIA